jgi:hypothetical protein
MYIRRKEEEEEEVGEDRIGSGMILRRFELELLGRCRRVSSPCVGRAVILLLSSIDHPSFRCRDMDGIANSINLHTDRYSLEHVQYSVGLGISI